MVVEAHGGVCCGGSLGGCLKWRGVIHERAV